MKKLSKWVPHGLTTNKKKSSFSSVVFSYSPQQQWTISWSDCDVCWKADFVGQPLMNFSVVGLRSSSKALPKAKHASNKGHGHCLVVCCRLIHYNFLNPSKTITSENYAQQIDEMHWKLQCLQLALVNRMDSVILHDNTKLHIVQLTLQKLNKLGYKVLPHLPCSPDLLPVDYHFFKHLDNFLQGKLPQPAGCRKCFPRVCGIPKHGYLC